VKLCRRFAEAVAGDMHEIKLIELDPQSLEKNMQLASRAERLVVAGGDGTVHELLPFLCRMPQPVGILPLGTGNDLARELGVLGRYPASSIAAWCDHYSKARARKFSVWECRTGSRCLLFCNYLSIGFDARAVELFDRWRRGALARMSMGGIWGNRLGYALAAAYAAVSPPLCGLSLTGSGAALPPLRSLIFSNIRSYMGLGISNPASNPYDEKIELLAAKSLLSYLAMLADYRFGASSVMKFESAAAWEVRSIPPGAFFQLDGEALGRIESGQLTVRMAGSINLLGE
jgi:diacylglycerol kinase family enzyme